MLSKTTSNNSLNPRISTQTLHKWLDATVTSNPNKKYTHILLKEKPACTDEIFDDLVTYVNDAHEPARRLLTSLLQDDLHPLDTVSTQNPCQGYPCALSPLTLRAYFGEILSGLIASHYELFESSNWEVPVFLFHAHDVAFQQLEYSNQTGSTTGDIPGRTGDDCLAFLRDDSGQIIGVMFCEAKCTTSHRTSLIKENHEKLSTNNLIPVDLLRVIEALKYFQEIEGSSQWISALRKLYFRKNHADRFDLSSYACGKSPVRKPTWISPDSPPESYTGSRQLTSVEIHFTDITRLVEMIYQAVGDLNV